MGDPLAAAALVMAVIAMLYGAWSPDITRAATMPLRAVKIDREKLDRPIITEVLKTKALPLWAGALAILLIFAWRTFRIVQTLCEAPTGAQFDDVGAAFVVTEIVTLLLLVSLTTQVGALRRQQRDCAKEDG